MHSLTESEALSLAILALNTLENPQGSTLEVPAQLDTHGGQAVEVLVRLRELAAAGTRCASCGWLISAGGGDSRPVQIVNEETGEFEHVDDLVACNHCPHVIRAHTAQAARRNRWTKGDCA